MAKTTNRCITLSEKICEAIKSQIASGIYLSDSSLPSSRALAEELGVSRSTVTVDFEQLVAEGYVEMSQGSRPHVSQSLHSAKSLEKKRPKIAVQLSEFSKRLQSLAPPKRLPGLKADFARVISRAWTSRIPHGEGL